MKSALERVIAQALKNPHMDGVEQITVCSMLRNAEVYGYGNFMAWLATVWATKLRDEEGCAEATAIEVATAPRIYTLPPPPKQGQRGTKKKG